MREAVGNSLLMGMVATIIGVIMIFFVGSISYSKAYKIKNRIINIIEDNGGWDDSLSSEIEKYLKEIGYQVGAGSRSNICSDNNIPGAEVMYKPQSNTGYNYCVISYDNGKYYKVVTFMRFEFPIIGNALEFPVTGESKTFGYFNGNE